jgi:hypothetical protein
MAVPNMATGRTGGFIRGEGQMYVHPNELLVNDSVTSKLKSFLNNGGVGKSSSENKNDYSVTFESGAITIKFEKAEERNAEKFAEDIMKIVERKQQMKRLANYKPINN